MLLLMHKKSLIWLVKKVTKLIVLYSLDLNDTRFDKKRNNIRILLRENNRKFINLLNKLIINY